MRQRWIIFFTLIVLAVTAGSSAWAAEPQAALGTGFTYQGRLEDANGPFEGVCDFSFALFAVPTGGSPTGGPLQREDIPVSAGIFTAELDFGSGAFTGEARWLEISVDCGAGAETLSPRQPITASPYALHAAGAPWSGLSGVPAGFADNLDDDILAGLDCTSGQIPEWNGSAWICGSDDTGGSGSFWALSGNSGTTAGTNFLGTTDDQPLELRVNGERALLLFPDLVSPNLIGGYHGNTVSAGVFGALIGGGGENSLINQVSDPFGTVGGGSDNQAGDGDTVVGDANYATVSGGYGNLAGNNYATVGGGSNNTASNQRSTVGGGAGNEANGSYSTVSGGRANITSGIYSAVGGGNENTAGGAGAFVGGGGQDGITYAGNQALGAASTVGGGLGNVITDTASYALIGGGLDNRANDESATIGGGANNTAGGREATVGGGSFNHAGTLFATVGGGNTNIAGGIGSTVGGGTGNTAVGEHAVIGGGDGNSASATFATVPGGWDASATHFGEWAYASGSFADAGDAQTSLYVLRNTTSNSTSLVNELFLNGGSERLTVAPDRTLTFNIMVVGHSLVSGASAGYQIRGVIENQGGTTALIGTPTIAVLGEEVASWDVTVTADDVNDALVITVDSTGTAPIVRWAARVETIEIGW